MVEIPPYGTVGIFTVQLCPPDPVQELCILPVTESIAAEDCDGDVFIGQLLFYAVVVDLVRAHEG